MKRRRIFSYVSYSPFEYDIFVAKGLFFKAKIGFAKVHNSVVDLRISYPNFEKYAPEIKTRILSLYKKANPLE